MSEALIETVRIIDGIAPLWPLHQWRLMNSAVLLGIALPEIEPPAGGADRIIRYEISNSGIDVTERDVVAAESLSLASSPAPHRGYQHKVAARSWLEAARTSSRMLGADDALMFDDQGRLVEATRWAVGWWDGETLCFPPLTLAGLRSVARARLTEMVRNGLRESTLTRDDLARRSFLACNAARGVLHVGMLDGLPLATNSRTTALAKRFWDRGHA